MQVYLSRPFLREAKSDGISDEGCEEAIQRAERGLIDADLGGRLIKQRIPRGNQGAARGSRAVIFYKRGEVAVFLYMFSKSSKANLTKSELAVFLDMAGILEEMTDAELHKLSIKKGWRELKI
jgi:hypothetical protein